MADTFERVRLWRGARKRLVGYVELAGDSLTLDIADEAEHNRISEVLEETGEVTWAWTSLGEGEMQEHRAKPGTAQWLRFVVTNILYPMGYQADFGVTEE